MPQEVMVAVSWNTVLGAVDDGWRARAACRHTEANLFFPVGSTGAPLDQVEKAKAFCRSCPVQEACLLFALATNQEDGIWGGKDEIERRRLRRTWRESRRSADSTNGRSRVGADDAGSPVGGTRGLQPEPNVSRR